MPAAAQHHVTESRGGDPHLDALMDRRAQVAMSIERRAAEVVRDWLSANGRDWLAVDFTKTHLASPLGGGEHLEAAVRELPRCVFRYAMDVRGNFIVRLAAVNAYLAREHSGRGPAGAGLRLELVVVRDPDGDTDTTLFVEGVAVGDGGYREYVVDAGRGHLYADWMQSRDEALRAASPAAAALLQECYDDPPGHQYIEGAPAGWPLQDDATR